MKEVILKTQKGFCWGNLRERGNLEEEKRVLVGKFEGKG